MAWAGYKGALQPLLTWHHRKVRAVQGSGCSRKLRDEPTLIDYLSVLPLLQFPVGFYPRDEEVSELSLGMADVSTNLVMLTGALGVGRSTLAASLAYDLVVSHHWTDAYWIDLQGINNMVLAGELLREGGQIGAPNFDAVEVLACMKIDCVGRIINKSA